MKLIPTRLYNTYRRHCSGVLLVYWEERCGGVNGFGRKVKGSTWTISTFLEYNKFRSGRSWSGHIRTSFWMDHYTFIHVKLTCF